MTDQTQPPIVVGIDGDETGQRALKWALREAQIRHCPVRVVSAWMFDPMGEFFTETSSQRTHQECIALIRRQVEQASTGMTDLPSITESSVEGDPIRVLPELARNAVMLVVGRHRGGLVREVLLGSVSAACIRHATCPVVVIPATVAPHEQAGTAEAQPASVPQS